MDLDLRMNNNLPRMPLARLAILLGMAAEVARAHQITLKFDDFPAHEPSPSGVTHEGVARGVLAPLRASGAPPVYGFVNGVCITENGGDSAVLDVWRKAGYPSGNHAWSRMNLNDHTAAEFEADVLKDEPVLAESKRAESWHWLRFPYLSEGDLPGKTFRR